MSKFEKIKPLLVSMSLVEMHSRLTPAMRHRGACVLPADFSSRGFSSVLFVEAGPEREDWRLGRSVTYL